LRGSGSVSVVEMAGLLFQKFEGTTVDKKTIFLWSTKVGGRIDEELRIVYERVF